MGFYTDRSPTAHATERLHQRYWRCEHFPSATENFFERHDCACRDTKLEPWHNGTHRRG
jgi:hypothetical protein